MAKVIHGVVKGIFERMKMNKSTKTRQISKCIQAFVMVVETSVDIISRTSNGNEKPEAKSSQDASKMRPTPVWELL